MKWLHQLIGRLKSIVRRKGRAAQDTPTDTETSDLAKATAEEPTPATVTEPAKTPEPAKAPESPVAEHPATEAKPAKKDEPADPALSTLDHVKQTAELQATSADPAPATPAATKPAPAPAKAATKATAATTATEGAAEAPYGPNSAKPAANGDAPSVDFAVKGKESSKLFHPAKSPYYNRTKADVWFKSEADAEGAGFQAWDHKKRTATKK